MMKLIFGCGYLGSRVAKRWHETGNDVAVDTRGADRVEEFRQLGYRPIVADITRPATLVELPTAETVLFAVGRDRDSSQSIEAIYAGGLQNVLAALPAETGRVITISTTGVYGPAAGDWVDEQTPPDPQRDGGRASLAAEEALAAHRLGKRGIILRLAGIYGPGRIPFLDKLRAGELIPAPSLGHLNLIHVDDAAAVVLAAARVEINDGPRVYCVSDGRATQRGDYYRAVARQIGAAEPQFVAPAADSPRAARAESDRRVANRRMLDELGVELKYPDYRAGLAAILG